MTTSSKVRVEIQLDLSENGIDRTRIVADTDAEQQMAHRFLERITPSLRLLDASIKLAGSEL